MSECERCGTDQTNHQFCISCMEYIELLKAHKALQEKVKVMSNEDILALDEVRSVCHGGGAAVSMAIDGSLGLNLYNMREMLRESSKKLVAVTDKYGGWDRISLLRGISGK